MEVALDLDLLEMRISKNKRNIFHPGDKTAKGFAIGWFGRTYGVELEVGIKVDK